MGRNGEVSMYDRIIVPIREGAGLEATEGGRRLAEAVGSGLTLLHVHRCREAPGELESLPQYRYQHVVETWGGRDAEAEAREVEWLGDLADAVAAAEPRLDVTSRVVHAPLSRCVASDHEHVLVVATVEGDEPLDPTVQEIIRTCGLPVLLLRREMSLLPIRRILVPLDGSTYSAEALAPAIDLARATGARLTLLEVVTRHSGLVRLLHPAERSEETAERALREVAERVPPELGPVEVRVVEHDSPTAGVMLETRRGEIDLVAMATHGRGGLRRLLLGSVAETVLDASPVPVMVFRPQAVGNEAGSPVTQPTA